jgi:hypothetical protein
MKEFLLMVIGTLFNHQNGFSGCCQFTSHNTYNSLYKVISIYEIIYARFFFYLHQHHYQ